MGDLNARSSTFNQTTNPNGRKLDEFLMESNLIILNEDKTPTYKQEMLDSFENTFTESILDYIISSKNLYNNFTSCKVKEDSELESNHNPIEATIKSNIKSIEIKINKKVRLYKKADWSRFQSKLNGCFINTENDINEQTKELMSYIINAANE